MNKDDRLCLWGIGIGAAGVVMVLALWIFLQATTPIPKWIFIDAEPSTSYIEPAPWHSLYYYDGEKYVLADPENEYCGGAIVGNKIYLDTCEEVSEQ